MAPIWIAVVDDEAAVCRALRRMLRLAGYEVAVFGSGEAFLASLATRVPACAILDVRMPGLCGLEVASHLRRSHSDIALVFITASEDPALAASVSSASGATVLRKPFSGEALLSAVRAALRRQGGEILNAVTRNRR